jgi:Tic22-like family
MKSLIHWSKTLGLAGSIILGSCLSYIPAALSLTAEQIVQKLSSVPVFTVADDKGAPLVASEKDANGEARIAGVFISQRDAQNFVTQLQKQNPELGKKVKVLPVSLGEVYQLAQENAKQKDGVNFTYVPVQTEVESAKKLSQANGQTEKFQGGVPLYVARGGEDKGYLTVERNNQQVIPFFFEKKQLEDLVSRFKQQKPDAASSITIEVVPLEGMIATLQKSNDKVLEKVVLVPSSESLEFLRALPQNQSKPQNQTQKKK